MKYLNRWFYALVGVIVLLLAGLIYAWSTMSKSIGAYTGWNAAQLSTAFTLAMAFFCIGCLIAGIYARRVHPKHYVRLSGILFLAGFMLVGFLGGSLPLLYLGFGVFGGLGAGFAYNAVMSTISAWFPDKQGMISGILLMGFGFSAFLVGKIFAAAAPADGSAVWMSVFRKMGLIIFVILAICSFFFIKPDTDAVLGKKSLPKRNGRAPASDVPAGVMMRSTAFWMYYIWAILLSAAGLALVSQANGIATQVAEAVGGMDDGRIATVVGLLSICNGVGRIFFGTLFDKKGYRATMLLDMVLFLVSTCCLLFAICSNSFPMIILGFVIGGFAYGGVTPTNSAIISDFFGRTHYSINFSIVITNLLIASFASTIAGNLRVTTGSYMSTIFLMIGVTAVGFAAFLAIKRPTTP